MKIAKDARILYMTTDKKTPALVELKYEKQVVQKGFKTDIKAYKLLNMDGKVVLQYEDKTAAKVGVLSKTNSSIFCYKSFFVREQSCITRGAETRFAYAYQAYDYSGKALFCNSDMWINDENLVRELEKKFAQQENSQEKE